MNGLPCEASILRATRNRKRERYTWTVIRSGPETTVMVRDDRALTESLIGKEQTGQHYGWLSVSMFALTVFQSFT